MQSTHFCQILRKIDFSQQISKNIQILNFTKIRLVEVDLFHTDGRTDGRTDMTKVIVGFRNFENAPKNEVLMRKCTLIPMFFFFFFKIK
jgi:hypothetical protein